MAKYRSRRSSMFTLRNVLGLSVMVFALAFGAAAVRYQVNYTPKAAETTSCSGISTQSACDTTIGCFWGLLPTTAPTVNCTSFSSSNCPMPPCVGRRINVKQCSSLTTMQECYAQKQCTTNLTPARCAGVNSADDNICYKFTTQSQCQNGTKKCYWKAQSLKSCAGEYYDYICDFPTYTPQNGCQGCKLICTPNSRTCIMNNTVINTCTPNGCFDVSRTCSSGTSCKPPDSYNSTTSCR